MVLRYHKSENALWCCINKVREYRRLEQIIAIGGGGFSEDGACAPIDEYLLQQCKVDNPILTFVPTASGDAEGYIQRFYEAFVGRCRLRHVSIIKPEGDPVSIILASDIIYVGGGNTKNMLALWREWGVASALSQALARGTVLCGLSAGAICWFDEGLTDSIPGTLSSIKCLGFLSGSACPHYVREPERRIEYPRMIRAGEIAPGYAIDDDVALHFINGKLAHVVTATLDRSAYLLSTRRVKTMRSERIQVSGEVPPLKITMSS